MLIKNYDELKLIISNLKKITLTPKYQRKKTYIPNKIRSYNRQNMTTKNSQSKGHKFLFICLFISLILLSLGFFYYQKTYSNDNKIVTTNSKKRTNRISISHLDNSEQSSKKDENTVIELTNSNSQKYQLQNNQNIDEITNLKDKTGFEKKITEILQSGQTPDNYGLYLFEPSSDYSFGVNENTVFYPASISKLPIAILILRDLENKKLNLTDKIELKEANKAYESDEMFSQPTGSFFPISVYLKKMISQSDNTAMTTLEEILGGSERINTRTKNELKVNLSRSPQITTGKDIGKLLENLYKNNYLNSQNTEYLIEMMVDVANWLQDRIPKGLPSGIEVAHKVGQIETDGGVVFADCGIIFGKKKDFILVFINQDVVQEEARLKIIEITKLAYNFFED